MEGLLLIILGGAVIYLWGRTDKLQKQVLLLKEWVDDLQLRVAEQHAAPEPDSQSAQEPPQPSVDPEVVPIEPRPLDRAKAVDEPAKPIPATPMAAEQPQELSEAAEQSREPLQSEIDAPTDPDTSEVSEVPEIQEVQAETPSPEYMPVSDKKFDFEDIFGRLLPIWAGGVTLAVAGFFLVRYSIEVGILGPKVRVALAFLFGGALLGAAEFAYRQEHRIADPRVRQAFAGAGLATLYASFYFAGSFYGFIGSAIAFLGMAGVTGASILLSFRFGLPSAILGLIGGFAAPMLVGSDDANLPVLSIYLALVTSGLTYAGNRQGRSWMALAALAGGIGWGGLILLSGVTGFADILAFGGYLVVLGAIIPAVTKGPEAGPIIRLGAAALAAIQMAIMVDQSDYNMLAWGLYSLLAATLAFFAWREPRLREATAFSGGLAIVMLALWDNVSALQFTPVAIGLLAIFVAVPLAHIWRNTHRNIDVYQIGGLALGLIFVTYGQFAWTGRDNLLALCCLAIAVLPALGGWLLWPRQGEAVGRNAAFMLASSAIGTVFAGLVATPAWMAPVVFSAVLLLLIFISWKRDEILLNGLIWTGISTMLVALVVTPGFGGEFQRLLGIASEADVMRSCLRWGAVFVPITTLALRGQGIKWAAGADFAAVVLLYGLAAQIIPGDMLAWFAAVGGVGLALLARARFAMRLAATVLVLSWAVLPVTQWLIAGFASIWGEPMLIAGDFGWKLLMLQMLPALAAFAALLIRPPFEVTKGTAATLIAAMGSLGIIAMHMAYKHLFAIETMLEFEQFGLAERTLWQAILLAGGIAMLRGVVASGWAKTSGLAAIAASLAYFVVYSLWLFNPLWSEQMVGALPLFNLISASFGLALIGAFLLKKHAASLANIQPWIFDAITMTLVSVLAFLELRQLFAGSIMVNVPVLQSEDLLRSLLGILLAVGFLLWGARNQSRSWRIGSLVLMLVAVFKVFLFDTSGLDGLARIASFVALGFSLIGIGWFYARQLRRPAPAPQEE